MNRAKQKLRDREIIRRVKAGESTASVAESFDLTRQAVNVILRRHGYRMQRRVAPVK